MALAQLFVSLSDGTSMQRYMLESLILLDPKLAYRAVNYVAAELAAKSAFSAKLWE